MTASRVLITWHFRKSRNLARYSRGLPSTRNMDVSGEPVDGPGALAWPIWTFSDRMHRRQLAILPLARPCAH